VILCAPADIPQSGGVLALVRWKPKAEETIQEEFLLKRLGRTRKLFAFLRLHRREILDDAFQDELEGMYRDSGAGKAPLAPGLMAMAALLQGYVGASDAETVELTVVDLRWQMVLDRLGEKKPAFSQGAFQEFRQRFIRTDMDRRLLEKTVEVARKTLAYDSGKLPKSLRVAMDSSPIEGAGRVEDTVNLLGHAARKVIACTAGLLDWTKSKVCKEAGVPALDAPSVKRGLDIDWGDPEQKRDAIKTLTKQLESLETFIQERLPEEMKRSPLKELLETLRQIIKQDLEPDPGGGGLRIRDGVAEDRRISIEDPQMRHGRKSKSNRFNGYKRHIARDIDQRLIVACAVTPGNRPEEEAAAELQKDIEAQGLSIGELYIDRGYIKSPIVNALRLAGGDVFCKPWSGHNGNPALFAKSDFKLDLRAKTITCPMGQVAPIQLGTVVSFGAKTCGPCPARAICTDAAAGRTVSISEDEPLQQQLRKQMATRSGRDRLRERVDVEHALAHVGQRQGKRARYPGVRSNTYDLRRAAAVQNLETIQRSAA
jgi:hypothetical protein